MSKRPNSTAKRSSKIFIGVASPILAELEPALRMARQIEQAGIRILELNIGTPYASQAKGVVSTQSDRRRATKIVSAMRGAISISLWVKITGQSERVPDLARAAFESGGEAVVMAGRSLGLIPDIETFEPMLGTTPRCGRILEFAPHLPVACLVTKSARDRQAADCDQWSAVRVGYRPHDVSWRVCGSNVFSSDAARLRCSLRGTGRVQRLSFSQEFCGHRFDRPVCRQSQTVFRDAIEDAKLEKPHSLMYSYNTRSIVGAILDELTATI